MRQIWRWVRSLEIIPMNAQSKCIIMIWIPPTLVLLFSVIINEKRKWASSHLLDNKNIMKWGTPFSVGNPLAAPTEKHRPSKHKDTTAAEQQQHANELPTTRFVFLISLQIRDRLCENVCTSCKHVWVFASTLRVIRRNANKKTHLTTRRQSLRRRRLRCIRQPQPQTTRSLACNGASGKKGQMPMHYAACDSAWDIIQTLAPTWTRIVCYGCCCCCCRSSSVAIKIAPQLCLTLMHFDVLLQSLVEWIECGGSLVVKWSGLVFFWTSHMNCTMCCILSHTIGFPT